MLEAKHAMLYLEMVLNVVHRSLWPKILVQGEIVYSVSKWYING